MHLGRAGPLDSPPDLVDLFTRRADSYARFIRVVLYGQGIQDYFLRSPSLRSGQRTLDAGCGTGAVTLALRDALLARGLIPGPFHAFDLTAAMLALFTRELQARAITGVETTSADVLRLEALHGSWKDYDLIVSASMLEYVPRERFVEALGRLRGLLAPGGAMVVFITRRNWLTRPLIGLWWRSHLYDAAELRAAFLEAGFERVQFGSFPGRSRHLALWGHIVEASGGGEKPRPTRGVG